MNMQEVLLLHRLRAPAQPSPCPQPTLQLGLPNLHSLFGWETALVHCALVRLDSDTYLHIWS